MRRRREQKPSLTDQRILTLHVAMVEKLLQNPSQIQHVKEVLDRRLSSGKLRHGGHLTWHCILELIDRPEEFRQAVLEDSYQMRRLRRKTPFVGLLTEEERTQALVAGNGATLREE